MWSRYNTKFSQLPNKQKVLVRRMNFLIFGMKGLKAKRNFTRVCLNFRLCCSSLALSAFAVVALHKAHGTFSPTSKILKWRNLLSDYSNSCTCRVAMLRERFFKVREKSGNFTFDKHFTRFWAQYPVKSAKRKILMAFKRSWSKCDYSTNLRSVTFVCYWWVATLTWSISELPIFE